MDDKPIGLGVVGFGGFGMFAVQHFVQVPGVQLAGMAGTFREQAKAAAKRFGVPDPVEVDEMVTWDNVDVVYIATPPFLHYEQAMKALQAGKHVLVEKPMALTVEQADEMLAVAREKDVTVVTDLMQRYNPLYHLVTRLIESKVLGEPLHGYFENYASDEGLGPDHWFWDRDKSGGIFIEHGVHFFDMFEGWLGPGTVEAAQASVRPGTNMEDELNCTVRYRDTILVNFYHGFTQPSRMDRQELRILFELGDLTLHEWVPTIAHIRAVADEVKTRELMEIFPTARLDVTEMYAPKDRDARGHGKSLDLWQRIEVTYGLGDKKWHNYGDLMLGIMTDQTAWIRDRSHQRVITEMNGRNSLAMAVDATRLAHA